jgi:hypothetical protein
VSASVIALIAGAANTTIVIFVVGGFDYRSVIIWCERFGVLISPADLRTTVAAN